MCQQDFNNMSKNFTLVFLFFGTFLCTLEGVLYFSAKEVNKNLKWNFIFVWFHLLISVILFAITHIKKNITDSENKVLHRSLIFMIHFCFSNFFLSLISINVVYFKLGIEIISFSLFMHTITKCILSFFLHKGFLMSLSVILINLIFKTLSLLGIHVIKAIIYYLTVNCAFTEIVLGFVYMYEYMTRKFFYSFLKLAKEKEYFLENLNYFNVYYFSSRNNMIEKYINIDQLINGSKPKLKKTFNLSSIEDLIRTSIVSVGLLTKDIQAYFTQCEYTNEFKFKKLLKIVNSKEEHKSFFKKFNNVGVI